MKRTVLLVLLLALAVPCLAFGQATAQKAVPTKAVSVAEKIMALERAWGEADRKYDVAWFERHLADSLVFTNAFGLVSTKADYVADTKAKNLKAESITASDMKVQTYGHVAVVTGVTVLVKATHKGEDMSGTVRWTDTWVRRKGVWQCVAGQTTKVK